MKDRRKYKTRAMPLDLVRRAKALDVTPGHLSQVISGKRISVRLTTRLGKLLESERIKPHKTNAAKKPQTPQ
jgi:plasmid maintenance system antidote protein VapI